MPDPTTASSIMLDQSAAFGPMLDADLSAKRERHIKLVTQTIKDHPQCFVLGWIKSDVEVAKQTKRDAIGVLLAEKQRATTGDHDLGLFMISVPDSAAPSMEELTALVLAVQQGHTVVGLTHMEVTEDDTFD